MHRFPLKNRLIEAFSSNILQNVNTFNTCNQERAYSTTDNKIHDKEKKNRDKNDNYTSDVLAERTNSNDTNHHHERTIHYREKGLRNENGGRVRSDANVRFSGPVPEGEVEHNIQLLHPQNLTSHYIYSSTPNASKEKENPLTKILTRKIRAHGPMPVSAFMKECLFHEEYGYYSTRENIFGKKGDFITSPEISSLFSEMIGYWIVSEWKNLNCPDEIRIVELGPGRGTLMRDALKTIESTKLWERANVRPAVVLVEKSKNLREEQRKTLQQRQIFDVKTGEGRGCYSHANASVQWVSSLDELMYSEESTELTPKCPVIVIAHEFFDALPINQFKFTDKGWCEYMVDTAEDLPMSEHFRFVLSPGATPNCTFAKMRANASPIWTYALKDKNDRLGRNLEVSNEAISYMQQIGLLIHENKGSALVIDYGYRTEIKDNDKVLTLQGIKDHKHVNPLSFPGEVDLSTFVDFYLLMYSVKQIPTIRAAKVLSQRDFLYRMGIDARLMKLMMSKTITREEMRKIYSAYKRLTDPKDMGESFKVLCISSHDLPTAFEDPRAYRQMESSKSDQQ